MQAALPIQLSEQILLDYGWSLVDNIVIEIVGII
jgi:hypothetical protein